MTEKIYDTDAYCREFDAKVTDCRERKGGWEISLDRSAFYPEGGGQPGDRGFLKITQEGEQKESMPFQEDGRNRTEQSIGDAKTEEEKTGGRDTASVKVTDTHEREGNIVLYTDCPLKPGTPVRGYVDWEYRFDLMQNHSGEHIVSGLIHRKYGYNNVGFHMGSDLLTVDLDGEFSREEMQELELEANRIVWENRSTQIKTYTEEEVKAIEYRSKKELHGEVRIVTFPGADTCACCGTHVSHTGEIGLIKLISLEKFKAGVRMGMLCGRRAMEYMNVIWEQNRRISVALSAKPFQTAEAVLRLKESDSKSIFQLNQMESQMFQEKADRLKGAGNVLLVENAMAADSVRKLAAAVMETCCGRCAVFAGNDTEGYKYAVGEKNGDVRELVKRMNAELNGRGGGKPFFAQGSAAAEAEKIRLFFEQQASD